MNAFFSKLVASSSDPKQLSLTVKGMLVMLVPVVALILKAAGHQIDNQALQDVIELIGNATIAVGSAVSAIAMVVGSIRKIYLSL